MTRSRLAIFALVALAVVAGAFSVFFFRASDVPQRSPIKLGVSPFQDTYLPVLAAKHNLFVQEGLDVELVKLDWPEVQVSLAAGQIDVGINNISSIVSTHSSAPFLVYAYGFNTFDDGFALMIRSSGPLKPLSYFLSRNRNRDEAIRRTAEQLRGRQVITTANTDMEQGVAATARRGRLDFRRDVRILNFPPAEGIAAFIRGDGDAYIGGIPQRAFANRSGMIEMLTGSDIGPAPINGYVTTRAFANTRMDDLVKLIHVWFKTVKYVNENFDSASREMADELNKAGNTGFTPDEFKKFWNKLEHYPANAVEVEDQILKPSGRNYWKARWDDCNDYFYRITGRIPKPVDPADAFIMYDVQRKYLEKYRDTEPMKGD